MIKRYARFWIMAICGLLADTTWLINWATKHLHLGTVKAYRAAGESWWAGEMRAGIGDYYIEDRSW